METPYFPTQIFAEDFNKVYEPAEDTFLLLDALEMDLGLINDCNPLICVEIGCGSGAVIVSLMKAMGKDKCQYFAIDINPDATSTTLKYSKINYIDNLNIINSNLIDCLNDNFHSCVELIVFNPPYVVTSNDEINESSLTRSWAGGENGRIIINQFLNSVVSRLTSSKCLLYLLLIEENKPKEIFDIMYSKGFTYQIILKRKCRNERLLVIRFTKIV